MEHNSIYTRQVESLFTGLPTLGSKEHSKMISFCEENRVQVLSTLPWAAAEIAGIDGFETMMEIIHKVGGRRLYLYNNVHRLNEKLNVSISINLYQRLSSHLSTDRFLDIPSTWGIFIALRRAAIQRALMRGAPNKDIVALFGVTERSLRKQRKTMGLNTV